MSAYRIAPAAESDWPWLLPLHVAVARASIPEATIIPESTDTYLRESAARLRQHLPNQAYIAWSEADARLGFIWAALVPHDLTGAPRAYVLMLYVAPEARRTGLGGKLLATAEDWGRAQGVDEIALSVAVHNTTARELYRRNGYSETQLTMARPLKGPRPTDQAGAE
jgi:aminoglycoside 6'-N-acetyltransferase I